MDAFTLAREMLGEMVLTPEQLAQLRAISHAHAQRLYTLLRRHAAANQGVDGTIPAAARRTTRELTEAELAGLRRMLEADVLSLLTPEQRRQLLER